jgi:hypothetical protein
MEFATPASAAPAWDAPATFLPGRRIEGYRNSSPRLIRLLGLGQVGSEVARAIGKRRLPNVAVATGMLAVDWPQLAGEIRGMPVNMIVLVCGEGDAALFAPGKGRPDALVTFVLLQNGAGTVASAVAGAPAGAAAADRRMTNAKNFSDLFVTTPDVDYVADLIDNLAS